MTTNAPMKSFTKASVIKDNHKPLVRKIRIAQVPTYLPNSTSHHRETETPM